MLDAKEERQHERLKGLAQRLHIPTFAAFIELEVFDKDGKLIQRHKQRSHSWTRNAYNHMFSQLAAKQATDAGLFEGGKLSIKDTGGTIRAINAIEIDGTACDAAGDGYRGAAASLENGIVVGTGTNAESFEDYALQTPIPEGAGGGELNYAEQEATAISYADTTLTATLIRYMNNNSGGSIGVNELGLIGQVKVDGATARYIMSSRDKLGATVTVPDTGQLKVTYTIELTYSA